MHKHYFKYDFLLDKLFFCFFFSIGLFFNCIFKIDLFVHTCYLDHKHKSIMFQNNRKITNSCYIKSQ